MARKQGYLKVLPSGQVMPAYAKTTTQKVTLSDDTYNEINVPDYALAATIRSAEEVIFGESNTADGFQDTRIEVNCADASATEHIYLKRTLSNDQIVYIEWFMGWSS